MKDAQPRTIYLKDYQAPDYLIDTTDLTFDLYEDHAMVSSVLGMRRNDDRDDGSFPELVLSGLDMELVCVQIDGRKLGPDEYVCSPDSLTIPVNSKQFQLGIHNRIRPQENTSLEGLYKSNGMFCTQCEAEGFRKITYYLDRPDVMSKFTTRIIADKALYPVLLSNGNDVEKGEMDNGRHWVKWEDPFKKPSYLFALVAGELEHITDSFTTMSGRDVTLKIYTEAHNIHQCDHAMASLKKAMKWDEEVYGREYDLDIFMIVAVDHFNMGAMENKGLNIFNSSCVLVSPETATDARFQRVEGVVAHEYFHNWSGDRVTCRDWFQLSLKEGFTVFRDSEFSADMNSRGVKRIENAALVRTLQFAEDSGPMSHPIRPESYMEISNFYTLTVYEKGAEVVRMIHTLLGSENFRKGTDLYFKRHDGHAATCEDFIKAMEDASGKDLKQFRRWYSQSGTPVLHVSDHFDAQKQCYSLTIEQRCPETPGQTEKQPLHIPVRMGLIGSDGKAVALDAQETTDTVLDVTEEKQTFVFNSISEKPLPSLLRRFSAPVRVDFAYSRDDLIFLAKHDADSFNRWDACQRLAISVINEQIDSRKSGTCLPLDKRLVNVFGDILSDDTLDYAMKAKMLALPSEEAIAEQSEVIEPQWIYEIREALKQAIAERHVEALLKMWQQLSVDKAYCPVARDIGERSLKNICLSYLTMLDDKKYSDLAIEQYHQAGNMTDRFSALGSVVNGAYQDQEEVQALLDNFLKRYRQDTNVIDQWLMVQATSKQWGTLDHIKALMKHEAFDAGNPNRLRSLVGGFSHNMPNFHIEDGAGYEFMAQFIIDLDRKNPQVAARILQPLTQWKRYEPVCRKAMETALKTIQCSPELSKDVYEIVHKSL
ncbi:Aminopeptidase N [invertebrate metagenome]|uniref:Aminopeptidase N n=1 Tax=invertebrate metagenome TaxID=1711999 RepID=A0A2H9T3J9_9ZZZZ